MPDLKKMTFVVACNSFFGRKYGQGLPEFKKELDALTPKDREDLIGMFRTVGIDATAQSGSQA